MPSLVSFDVNITKVFFMNSYLLYQLKNDFLFCEEML